jgi:hypothetical protein
MARGREEKGGLAWVRPRGGGRRRRGVAGMAVSSSGRPVMAPTIGRERRHCRVYRGGRREWATRATG